MKPLVINVLLDKNILSVTLKRKQYLKHIGVAMLAGASATITIGLVYCTMFIL